MYILSVCALYYTLYIIISIWILEKINNVVYIPACTLLFFLRSETHSHKWLKIYYSVLVQTSIMVGKQREASCGPYAWYMNLFAKPAWYCGRDEYMQLCIRTMEQYGCSGHPNIIVGLFCCVILYIKSPLESWFWVYVWVLMWESNHVRFDSLLSFLAFAVFCCVVLFSGAAIQMDFNPNVACSSFFFFFYIYI